MSGRLKAVFVRLCGGPYGELPSAFWWLWASAFVNRVANFVVPFCVLYFTVDRRMSASLAGLLAGFYGAGAVAGSLAGGLATDRFGGKRLLVTGYVAAAVCTIALGLTSEAIPLCAEISFAGVFAGVTRPATNALISHIVPAQSRVRVFALNYWAMNLGFAIACVAAALIAKVGYTILFGLDGATSIVCAIMVLFRVSDVRVPHGSMRLLKQLRRSQFQRTMWLGPLRDPLFAAVVLMSVLSAALLQQLTATLPLSMRLSGHSPATYGVVAALNGVLVCSLQMPISSLVARRSLLLSLGVGSGLMAAGLGLTAFATSVAGYVATLTVWTVGETIAAPAAPALASLLAGSAEQGSYHGVLAAAWGVGAVGGPIAGTWVFASVGNAALWSACAVAGTTMAGGYLFLRRPVAARLALLQSDQLHINTFAV